MSIKISELGDSAELNGGEYVPIVQNGATVKTSTKDIAGLIGIDYTPENVANKSSNTSLGTSDTLYPTQNAVKTYVDGAMTSLVRDRGNYDASSNQFPITGMGSGTGGAVMAGDLWYISVAGTLGGVSVLVGYSIRALINNPGQNASNWGILNVGLGYIPENVANKSNDTALGTSTTLYPTQNAVKTYVDANSGLTSVGLQLGTSGSNLSVTSSPLTANGTITLNVPDASETARGVVTSNDQSFGGIKTFSKIKSGGIQLDVTTSEYSNTGFATLWSGNVANFNVLNIKTSSGLTSSLKMPNTGAYTYTFPTSSGTVALISDLTSGYVPYLNATNNVDLGSHDIKATKLKVLDTNYSDYWAIYNKITIGDSYLTIQDAKQYDRIIISGTIGYTGSENSIAIKNNTQTSKLLFTSNFSIDYTYTFPEESGHIALGSGVVNKLARWDSESVLEDSQIYDNGSSVGIGTTSPIPGALLQLDSTTQGFILPRMTTAQREAITSLTPGLMVYQTDNYGSGEGVYVYTNSDGWLKLAFEYPL